MSELERDCLFGENKVGYMELWNMRPKDKDGNYALELLTHDRDQRVAALETMAERGIRRILSNLWRDTVVRRAVSVRPCAFTQ